MRLTKDRTDEADVDLVEDHATRTPAGREAVKAIPVDRLFATQAPSLFRRFRRKTTIDQAQDLLQETFTRFIAPRSLAGPPIDRPEAYLSRIAGNLLRDRARVAQRRSDALHMSSDEIALSAPDQIHVLEARDLIDRLETALLRLPVKTREIFLAHRLDGYSYAEIAARTGLSVKAVEKQMSTAIAHLARFTRHRE